MVERGEKAVATLGTWDGDDVLQMIYWAQACHGAVFPNGWVPNQLSIMPCAYGYGDVGRCKGDANLACSLRECGSCVDHGVS